MLKHEVVRKYLLRKWCFSRVIRRMVGLLASNATLDVEREAAMKQAKSASKTAETLLESAGNASDAGNAKELAEKLEKAEKG